LRSSVKVEWAGSESTVPLTVRAFFPSTCTATGFWPSGPTVRSANTVCTFAASAGSGVVMSVADVRPSTRPANDRLLEFGEKTLT
jgi:hypothetical protein